MLNKFVQKLNECFRKEFTTEVPCTEVPGKHTLWHTVVAQAMERVEDKPVDPFWQGLALGLALGFVLGICVLGLVITGG